MVEINIKNNNQGSLSGDEWELKLLYKAFKVKNPNAFFMRKAMPRGWDGCQDFITKTGTFKTGLLNKIIDTCEEFKIDFEINDHRKILEEPIIPKEVGSFVVRPYQFESVEDLLINNDRGLQHYVGVMDMATNAGKTLLMCMIYEAFNRKHKAIMLLNSSDLFNQFKEEIPNILLDADIKFVQGKQKEFGHFTVAMVQTLSSSLKTLKSQLSEFEIVVVDEADLANNKTYKNVISFLINTRVRVGLSGSIYKSKLAKDKMNHMSLESFIGPIKANISKKEMIELGFSSNLKITISEGNTKKGITGYQEEYKKLITTNSDRHHKIYRRILKHKKRGRLPIVVVCQFHEHIDQLYEYLTERMDDRIVYVHGEVKGRKSIFKDFKEGRIDILISSFIIRRGINFPNLRVIINAAGSDSQETIIQIMGRAEREGEGINVKYVEDFFDEGKYLKRHSKHRINYYKQEGLKVRIKL